mmetsp:Transcript_71091/g.199787  ORF Transcript_71091/g.199787 Transcript_71091/m.199787 type:complete len:750 (-) Transcript_71091:548-2797(-)
MASDATTRVMGSSSMGRKLPSLTQLNALEELVGSSLAEAIDTMTINQSNGQNASTDGDASSGAPSPATTPAPPTPRQPSPPPTPWSQLRTFTCETESRGLLLLNVENVEVEHLRTRCMEQGSLKYLEMEFQQSHGVVFVAYQDLRAAESAFRSLGRNVVSSTPIAVHYSVPLDASMTPREHVLILRDAPSEVRDEEVRNVFSCFGTLRSLHKEVTVSTQEVATSTSTYSVEFLSIADAKQAAFQVGSASPWPGHPVKVEFAKQIAADEKGSRQLLTVLLQWRKDMHGRQGQASAPQQPQPQASMPQQQGGTAHRSASVEGETPLSGESSPRESSAAATSSGQPSGQTHAGGDEPVGPSPSGAPPPSQHAMYQQQQPAQQQQQPAQQYYPSQGAYMQIPPNYVYNAPQDYVQQMMPVPHTHLHAAEQGHASMNVPSASGGSLGPPPHLAGVQGMGVGGGGPGMPPVPMPPPPGTSSPNGMPMQGMNAMSVNGMNGMSGVPFMNMQSPQQPPQQGVSDLSNGGTNAPQGMQQPRANSLQGNQMNIAQGHTQGQPQHSASSGSGSNGNSNNAGGRRRHNSRDGNGSHAIGDGEFGLNIDHIMQGVDRRTTVMIRNIPNKYTQMAVLEEINQHFKGTYDFFYLPIDFKNKCNVGYAFINFIEFRAIVPFVCKYHGRRWNNFNSEKVCAITYARIQGKASMISRFQNSSLMDKSGEFRPLLFQSTGVNRGLPEPFPACSQKFNNKSKQRGSHSS